MAMARAQTMVQLSDELVTSLDEEAAHLGVSRSALIRSVLTDHLREHGQAAIGRQIAGGYRRVPPSEPDEWGDLAALGDRATADLLTRLDAEERAQGFGPW